MEIYESTKIAYIYGLYEIGKEDDIRYIGKSEVPFIRYNAHLNNGRKLNTYKDCWIKSLKDKNIKIGIKILEVVDFNVWEIKETYWIEKYLKLYEGSSVKLTNMNIGGKGGSIKFRMSYEECKEIVNKIKPDYVNNIRLWKVWKNSSEFPDILPKSPNRVLVGWRGWGDFLNTNFIHTHNRINQYLTYDECRKYLKKNYKLSNSVDFKKLRNKPQFIPSKPFNVYDEWVSWSEFLGYEPKKRSNKNEYLSYNEAKVWISKNLPNVKTAKAYRELALLNKLPIFIHKKPERFYKKEFLSFYDYLGKIKISDTYFSFEESRNIVRSLNIKSNAEWRIWIKNKPEEYSSIPNSPDYTYKSEWIDWFDFLGNKKVA